MSAPKDRSIYQIAWAMLNDEFKPHDDTYKGVSKEIHNAALEAGWRLLDAEQLALLFGPAPTELDRLRRWKAEATEVLSHWDAVAERFDLSGHLGEFTADAVLTEVKLLQEKQ